MIPRKRYWSGTNSLWMVIMLAGIVPTAVQAQLSTTELSKTLKVETLQHPYLYFTEAEKPAILRRIQTDPESRTIMKGLLAEGHRLLYVPVQNPPPARVKHPRYAEAGDPLNQYSGTLIRRDEACVPLSDDR